MKLLLCALLVYGSLLLVTPAVSAAGALTIDAVVLVLDDDPWDRRRRSPRRRGRHVYGPANNG